MWAFTLVGRITTIYPRVMAVPTALSSRNIMYLPVDPFDDPDKVFNVLNRRLKSEGMLRKQKEKKVEIIICIKC
jgi:hypothetical protein